MSVHDYHCSVCQGSFGTRKEWLSHLLEFNHQTKARKEICRWNQTEIDCVLVVYATFPIASLEFLQFFSNGSANLVTDFVWFESRPKMGFLQFESKHKVAEIFSGFASPQIRMNNQLLQIRKAGECLRLEWQELIPSPFHDNDDDLLEASNTTPSRPPPDIVVPTSNLSSHEANNSGKDEESIPIVLQSGETESAQSLMAQFKAICQAMEIPDDEYETALQLTEELQKQLRFKYFAGCKLIWFRNWFLKLQNTSSLNELVFFLDEKGMFENGSNDDTKSDLEHCPPLKTGTVNHVLLSHSRNLGLRKLTKQICPTLYADKTRLSFQCRKYDFLFSVVKNSSIVLPELQTCRLLSYLCSFDPRVKPLLTVIRYWAKVNEIRLAKPGITPVCRAPDPAALDWLVIFFLCYKKKILPSSREITERPHAKLIFQNVDIGFAEDADFAQQFSSRYDEQNEKVHALNIFNLAEQFFNFYGADILPGKRKFVFNMKDGEMIPMEAFVWKISKIKTKLRSREIKTARKGKKTNPPNVIFIHPLYIQHGFAFCDKSFVSSVCPAMQITGKKLKLALDKIKRGQKVDDITSAFKVN
ncbi:Poly(A) RNA polymerase cid13, partial [Orchesella cincta]